MSLRIFSEGPYYDDFAETKGFYRVLFKPGVAVQARELTQLQTILQKQIERFGSSTFQEGSMVLGGATTSDFSLHFLRISSTLLNGATIDTLVGQMLIGVTSGATAKVISYTTETAYPNGYTLLCKFFQPSDPNTTPATYFTAGEVLKYQPDPLVAGTNEATLISTAYVYQGACSVFSISEGVFYTRGNFVYCPAQTIAIAFDVYDTGGTVIYDATRPSARLGLVVNEQVIDSDLDSTLLDPSLGSYNYNAPGADRYSIVLALTAKPLLKQAIAVVGIDSGTTGLNTFTIINGGSGYPTVNYNTVPITITDPTGVNGAAVVGGVDTYTGAITSIIRTAAGSGYKQSTVRVTVAQPVEEDDKWIELARYDAGILVKNVVNPQYSVIGDTMARRTYDESGDYSLNPFLVRMSDSASGDDWFTANVDPGKAYVKGYEITLISTSKLDILRARDADHQRSVVGYNINSYYGNYVLVDGTNITKPFVASDPGANEAYPILRLLSGAFAVGTARLAQITWDSGTLYRFHLSDVNVTDPNVGFANVDEIQLMSDASTSVPVLEANRALIDSSVSSLMYQLPVRNTKTISGSIDYTYWVKKTGTVDGSGNLTISDNTGGQFRAVANVTSEMSSAYVVYNTSTSGTIPLEGGVVTITASGISPTTAVFTGLPAGVNVTVLALLDISGVAAKTKTLNNGSPTGAYVENIVLTTDDVANGYVTLGCWDGAKFIQALVGSDDVTSRFTFDSGQRDASYQYARLLLKSHEIMPVAGSTLVVVYDYYFHSTTGHFFCADSYPDYDEIPVYYAKDGSAMPLEDIIDFRPNADSTNPPTMPYIQEDLKLNYTYYIGRADRLVLTRRGELISVEGIPSLTPKVPKADKNSMTLGYIYIAPYTKNVSKDVKYVSVDNRRYTMRDIGVLDQRISRLEYYNTLSLLEKSAKDMLILDTNGLDRFKNGTLVDSFTGYSVADVNNVDLYCGIDMAEQFMTCTNVVETKLARAINVTRVNTAISNQFLTLAYSSVPCITQGEASEDISVNPFNVSVFNGKLLTNPPSDFWKDVTQLPDIVVNVTGENDHLVEPVTNVPAPIPEPKLFIEPLDPPTVFSAPGSGSSRKCPEKDRTIRNPLGHPRFEEPDGTGAGDYVVRNVLGRVPTAREQHKFFNFDQQYNHWSTNFDGREKGVVSERRKNRTPNVSNNATPTLDIEESTAQNSSVVSASTKTVGDTVVNTSVVSLMRPIDVVWAATGLRPTSRMWPFFDDVSIQYNIARCDYIAVSVLGGAAVPTIISFENSDYAHVSQTVIGGTATGRVVMCRNGIMHVLRDPRSLPFAANGNPLEFIWTTVSPSGITDITNTTYTVDAVLIGSRQQLLTDGSTLTFALEHQVTTPYSWTDIRVSLNGVAAAHTTQWVLDVTGENLTWIDGTPSAFDTIYVYYPWLTRTDSNGNISGLFGIPVNTFHTGERILRLIDNSDNTVTGLTSHADCVFFAQGLVEQTQTTIVTTRPPIIVEPPTIVPEPPIPAPDPIVTDITPDTAPPVAWELDPVPAEWFWPPATGWYDPLAQSFLVDATLYPNGIFLESVDLCFRTKDPALPVSIQIRPMVNGYPHSSLYLPGSLVEKDSAEVNITGVLGQDPLPGVGSTIDGELVPSFSDPRTVTNFKFPAPLFLKPGVDYALVVRSDSDLYHTFIAKVGSTQLGSSALITSQPYAGSLFLSQNASTWSADQTSDLMFRLNQCRFASAGSLELVPDGFTSIVPFPYDIFWASANNIEFDGIANVNYGIKTTDEATGLRATEYTPFFIRDNLYLNSRQVLTTESTDIAAVTSQTTYTLPFPNADIDQMDVLLLDTVDPSIEVLQSKNIYVVRDKAAAPLGTKELVWQSSIKPVPSTGENIRVVRSNSAVIQMTLSTTDRNVSPLIDLSQFSLRFIRNEINSGAVVESTFKLPDTAVAANTTMAVPTISLVTGVGGALRTETIGGMLNHVYVDSAGSGYSAGNATVSAPGGGGVNATVQLVVDGGGGITGVTITNVGSGYDQATLALTSTTGSGAIVYPVVEQMITGDAASGQVTGWFVADGGHDYVDDFTATLTRTDASTTPVITTTECTGVGGNCETRYISRRVTLADGFDAKDMQIYLTTMKPQNCRVEAYYKVLAADDNTDWSVRPWVRMVNTGDVQSLNMDDYKELQFNTVGGTCAYDGFESYKIFAVKIVLTALNTASVPRVRGLRAIALASTFA